MNRKALNCLGLVGLILMAALAVFYVFTKKQQKNADRRPMDDRGLR